MESTTVDVDPDRTHIAPKDCSSNFSPGSERCTRALRANPHASRFAAPDLPIQVGVQRIDHADRSEWSSDQLYVPELTQTFRKLPPILDDGAQADEQPDRHPLGGRREPCLS